MKPSDLTKTLTVAFASKLKILIKGAPGIGKSDIVTAAATAAGCKLVIMHPAISDPIDFKGLPALVNEGDAREGTGRMVAEFLPYGQLRRLVEATEPTVCFIDDIGQAPHSVQAAIMQLILQREVDGQKISEHIVFCGATNDSSHMAGVQSILEPVKSRWHSIVELNVDLQDWMRWAVANNIPEQVIAFIGFRKEPLLHNFKATRELTNSPSPRTVAAAAALYRAGLYSHELLAGACGDGWAAEFRGFLKVYRSLPDPDLCIKDPENAPLPDANDAATMYAISVALSLRATKKNFKGVTAYLKRLPKEFEVFAIRDSIQRESELQDTSAFTEWAIANTEVLA